MPEILSNRKSVCYAVGRGEVQPGRKTLVFVHGSGGSRLLWNYQRQFFEESYNLILVDLPGHGEAAGLGEESVEAYVNHLYRLIRSLPADSFCLLGHSLGGAIVQTFVLLYPEYVEALVLVGTGARLRVLPEILIGIRERFAETVRLINEYAFSRKTPRALIEKGIETMLRTSQEVLHGDFTACDRFDIMERVRDIQCPTLVVCGEDDALTPPKYARYLAEMIQNARIEVIEDAGHMVMIEQPGVFNRMVLEFLEALSKNGTIG